MQTTSQKTDVIMTKYLISDGCRLKKRVDTSCKLATFKEIDEMPQQHIVSRQQLWNRSIQPSSIRQKTHKIPKLPLHCSSMQQNGQLLIKNLENTLRADSKGHRKA